MTRIMPRKTMQKIGFLSLLLALLSIVGCGQSSKPPSDAVEPSAASRPALKIWIVDAPELVQELSVRWQAASDQPLRIESVSIRDAIAREPFNADVVIYPGTLLGDLVKKDAIGLLPSEAIATKESEKTLESIVYSWPVRWRNIVTFGRELYAVPLGATNLGAIQCGVGLGPLDELQTLLSGGKDLKAQSTDHWNQVLTNSEKASTTNASQREQSLQQSLAILSDEEKASLVDRFLFIASTTNARSRGLFDLLKMESRLSEPDFVKTVKVLSRMARLFPETFAVEPSKAWETAASKKNSASFAIGWPSSLAASSDEGTNSSIKLGVAPITWNPVRGLIASVGRKTKQTAVSCQFLLWLGEPDQREALRAVCPRVELTAEQFDRNSGRDDYRAFQLINNRDTRVEPMELSLRMANADQYRSILADSLISAIKSPDQIDTIMNACSQQWDQLTVKLGIDTQRISEEQSLGYRK